MQWSIHDRLARKRAQMVLNNVGWKGMGQITQTFDLAKKQEAMEGGE